MSESIPASRVLGVFGMSIFTRRDDLEKVFSEYGPIEKCEIITNRQVKSKQKLIFIVCRLEDRRDSVSSILNAWKMPKLLV